MLNDILFIKLFQTSAVGSPIILNTFHYMHVAGDADACTTEMAATFLANVIPGIRAFQAPHITHTNLTVINLMNPLDYVEEGLSLSGLADVTGDPLPDFVCWSFLLTRARRDIRNGHKRFAGVGEGQINGNSVRASDLALLNTGAALLKQDLPASDELFRPIIYGDIIPGKRAAPIWSRIVNCSFQYVSTQNTRKRFA